MKFYKIFLLTSFLFAFTACKEDNLGGKKPFLISESKEIVFNEMGGELTINIISNVDVTFTAQDAWYSVDEIGGSDKPDIHVFRIIALGSKEPRQSKIIFSAKKCKDLVIDVIQLVLLGDDNDIQLFSLKKDINNALKDDINFEYDESTNTFSAKYLKWIDKVNPEMLTPTFTTSGDRVLLNGIDVVSDITPISFAEDITLKVEAENGDIQEYNIVLNCPQINTELAVLHMKPDQLIADRDNYVQTHIEIYDKTPESTNTGWWDSDEKGKIEVRGRGNSTWPLPKKPYRMKFTEDFSPLGLDHASEKNWVLLAHDMDKSLIRNHLALEYSKILFNKDENYHDDLAILFTPASKYINVYLTGDYYDSSTGKTEYKNGEYLGIYQMSDHLQRKKGRINVDKLNAADGDSPKKITGGYIIETDIHEGNHYSKYKNVAMTYKYPEDDDYHPSQYEYISNHIAKAEECLYGNNFKDPVNGWRKYFDEKTLADFIIVKELAGDMDGYTSTYMYKRRGCDKLFFGPIWDCDKGWDNEIRQRQEYSPSFNYLMIYSGFWMPGVTNYDWYQRFWDDETFRAFVNTRWKQKRSELIALTENALNELPKTMAKAIEANFTVWPFYYQFSQEAKMPAQTYPEEIERIRTLAQNRVTLLDKEFAK